MPIKPKLEALVKGQVKTVLKAHQVAYFMPVMGMHGTSGVSDFIACVPTLITPEMVGQRVGVFMAIETKQVGKLATPLQQFFLEKIEAAHGVARLVKGVKTETGDIATLDSDLKRMTQWHR